jgi:hypothetical protein
MYTNIFFYHISPNHSKMRNVSKKSCRENQNTNFMFNNLFSFEMRAVYETMRKNIVEPGRSQMTIRRMRIAVCILNPYPANVENIVSSYQCYQMADGI